MYQCLHLQNTFVIWKPHQLKVSWYLVLVVEPIFLLDTKQNIPASRPTFATNFSKWILRILKFNKSSTIPNWLQ